MKQIFSLTALALALSILVENCNSKNQDKEVLFFEVINDSVSQQVNLSFLNDKKDSVRFLVNFKNLTTGVNVKFEAVAKVTEYSHPEAETDEDLDGQTYAVQQYWYKENNCPLELRFDRVYEKRLTIAWRCSSGSEIYTGVMHASGK